MNSNCFLSWIVADMYDLVMKNTHIFIFGFMFL